RFAGVDESDLLWRGDDDGAGKRDRLDNSQLDVASAGGKIEHEKIELAPFHLSQKLLRVTGHHRSAQDRRRSIVEQKPHRHQFEIVLLNRNDLIFFGGGWSFARAEHERNARTINVAIAQA